jgi:hypothetical protein
LVAGHEPGAGRGSAGTGVRWASLLVCLALAVRTQQVYEIWCGTTEEERAIARQGLIGEERHFALGAGAELPCGQAARSPRSAKTLA